MRAEWQRFALSSCTRTDVGWAADRFFDAFGGPIDVSAQDSMISSDASS